MPTCPAPREIESFLLGGLSSEAAAVIQAHLAHCDPCRALLDPLFGRAISATAAEVEPRGSDAASAATLNALERHDESAEGRSLGRYRIVRLLGRGGQGQVYLAEDTVLSRSVALKVLKATFCTASVEGVVTLELFAECPGSNHYAHAVWLDPVVSR